MIPWMLVAAIDAVAWRLGYQTYVWATGGPGWHRGRFGADRISFIRRTGEEKRLPKLKAHKPNLNT